MPRKKSKRRLSSKSKATPSPAGRRLGSSIERLEDRIALTADFGNLAIAAELLESGAFAELRSNWAQNEELSASQIGETVAAASFALPQSFESFPEVLTASGRPISSAEPALRDRIDSRVSADLSSYASQSANHKHQLDHQPIDKARSSRKIANNFDLSRRGDLRHLAISTIVAHYDFNSRFDFTEAYGTGQTAPLSTSQSSSSALNLNSFSHEAALSLPFGLAMDTSSGVALPPQLSNPQPGLLEVSAISETVTNNSGVIVEPDSFTDTGSNSTYTDALVSVDHVDIVAEGSVNPSFSTENTNATKPVITEFTAGGLVTISDLADNGKSESARTETSEIERVVNRILSNLHSPSTRAEHENETQATGGTSDASDLMSEGGMVLLDTASGTVQGGELLVLDEAFAEIGELFDIDVRMKPTIGVYRAFDVAAPEDNFDRELSRSTAQTNLESSHSTEAEASSQPSRWAQFTEHAAGGMFAAIAAVRVRKNLRRRRQHRPVEAK
ncbi:MAG: hypothetical protein AAGD11_09250 [Planctomycetota bacterium]